MWSWQSRARSPQPLSEARSPEPARGQRGVRGRVRAPAASPSPVLPAGDQTSKAPQLAGPSALPGICVLPRAPPRLVEPAPARVPRTQVPGGLVCRPRRCPPRRAGSAAPKHLCLRSAWPRGPESLESLGSLRKAFLSRVAGRGRSGGRPVWRRRGRCGCGCSRAAPRAPGRGGPACRALRPGRARRYPASRAH